jgi:hypothetical protein
MEQLTATFRALGCDHATVVWDYGPTDPEGNYIFTAGWHDGSDRLPVKVVMRGHDPVRLMVLGGIAMSKKLAEERPELTFPDVVWT